MDTIVWILFSIFFVYCLWAIFTKKGKEFTAKQQEKLALEKAQKQAAKQKIKNIPSDTLPPPIYFEFGNDPVAKIAYTNGEGDFAERNIIVKDVFMSDNGYWQIKAIDTKKHKMRQFRLDRIHWIEHNGWGFSREHEILELAQALKGWM